jgi:hypothetical protein
MMSEADVVDKLVEFTQVTLAGVSVYFTIVSAYVAALNYFIGSAAMVARLLAFLFFCVVLGMLVAVMAGAQVTHAALIARLRELNATGELSAVGKALLTNTEGTAIAYAGYAFSIDALIQGIVYAVLGITFVALFFMTFFHRWQQETVPVALVNR